MNDDLAVALKARFDELGATLAPSPGLVPAARRRYRRQRLASAAAAVGGLACLAGGGVAAVQWLQPPGQSVATVGAAAGGSADGGASASTEPGAGVTLEVGGLPFPLPAGFRPTSPVEITDLTPTAADPSLPGGVSLVALAEPAAGPEVGTVSIALYKGAVVQESGARDDVTAFGSTPVEHLTIDGHPARLAVVADCGDGCDVPKPVDRGGAVPPDCDTGVRCVFLANGGDGVTVGPAPFPHIDVEVVLGPDAVLRVGTAGLSRDDVVAMVTRAVEADGVAVDPED